MSNAHYTLFVGANEQIYFNLKAGNGQIILQSEGYVSKAGAENGIESVRVNSPIDERYRRIENGDDFHFNLLAANHEIIGTSEMYVSRAGMENGIESVKTNAPDAPVEDRT